MDLSARIEDLRINPAIMNASGILSFVPVLKRVADFKIGALVTKSANYEGKEGFDNPIFVKCSEEAWLNAVGLPNEGCEAKKKELEELYPYFRSVKKPLIVSLFDSSSEKIAKSISELEKNCDAFELNLSCANLMPGEKHGLLTGRDPELVKEYTRAAKESTRKPVIIKLPPGPFIDDRERIKEIALSAAASGADAISAINTIPGGMKIDIFARKPVLAAKYGSMSGRSVKPFGIGCVYTLYEALQAEGYKIPIIGIGGIETAEDIIEYTEAGASAVAIGTALVGLNLDDIKKYLSELVINLGKILESMNINNLREIVGVAHA